MGDEYKNGVSSKKGNVGDVLQPIDYQQYSYLEIHKSNFYKINKSRNKLFEAVVAEEVMVQ